MMNEPQNDSAPDRKKSGSGQDGAERTAPWLGRRLLVSASLAAPTLLTLGRAAHSQLANQTMTQNSKKKKKKKGSQGTASQLASIKKRSSKK